LLSNVSNQKILALSTLEGHNQCGGEGGVVLKVAPPHWLDIKVDNHEYIKKKHD
jgi:hypothetical protein